MSILPSDQTITANANGATTVMISVWVKQASEGLSSLRLVDEAGAALTYVTVGTPSYAINSVNTYRVTIPAGKTLQHIQALSNVCETLNNGDNNYTACSNDADVNLATQGHGILSVQPTQFNLSESYESQVITLTNIGTGNVGSITYPTFSSPFSVVTNNCSSVTTLTPGQSCTMTVKYTAGSTAGQITPVFGYDDDNDAATEPKNTAIIIGYAAAIVPDPGPGPGPAPVTPFSILSVTPTSASLTAENSRKVFTITNTPGGSTAGVTIASGWTLPTLSAPLQMESTNCYASSGSVGLGAPVPMVTKALAVGASCTYTIKYSSAVSAGSATLPFTYNNGINSQTTDVAVNWTIYTPPAEAVYSVRFANNNAGVVYKCILNPLNGNIDSCSNASTSPTQLPIGASGIAFNQSRSLVYFTNQNFGQFMNHFISVCPMINTQIDTPNCTTYSGPTPNTTFNAPIGIVLNHTKQKAYIANNGSSTIAVCDIGINGLIINNSCVNKNLPGLEAIGRGYFITLNPDNSYLYVTNGNTANGKVHKCLLNQNDGSVSDCTDAGGSGFVVPAGIIVNSTNTIAYIVNTIISGTGYVSKCTINQQTHNFDTCTQTATNVDNSNGIAIDETGSYVYINHNTSGEVTRCQVDTTSKDLTECIVTTSGLGSNLIGISYY